MSLLVVAALGVSPVPPASAVPAPAQPADTRADPAGTWPLEPLPEVVSAFDPPDSPWGAGHRGVDLLGGLGQQVRAAMNGRISFAAPLAGRGVVVVDHGRTRTTYEPLVPTVAVGDTVSAGQVIGRLSSPGSHCWPRLCLHWGWKRGETYLDPLLLVGGGPVRLLPIWGGSTAPTSQAPARPYAAWRPPAQAGAGYLP